MKTIPKAEGEGGWIIDFEFLQEVKENLEDNLLMSEEEIELVLICLYRMGYVDLC